MDCPARAVDAPEAVDFAFALVLLARLIESLSRQQVERYGYARLGFEAGKTTRRLVMSSGSSSGEWLALECSARLGSELGQVVSGLTSRSKCCSVAVLLLRVCRRSPRASLLPPSGEKGRVEDEPSRSRWSTGAVRGIWRRRRQRGRTRDFLRGECQGPVVRRRQPRRCGLLRSRQQTRAPRPRSRRRLYRFRPCLRW